MARPQVSHNGIAVARGDEPADLLITGGNVFVPSIRGWKKTSLAIADGWVVGWGERDAITTIDVGGAALTPGFIDSHMHLESTKLWVDEFVRAVLPHGTTAVAADPHEIANVFGVPGVAALAELAKGMPFEFGITASSCVPASPFESSGAQLDHTDVAKLLDDIGAIGVAEVMNYPGVIAGDPEMLARIAAAGHRRVDGHAPGLTGSDLDAYLTAGVESDHECVTLAEAVEKREKGMWVFMREGSASQNLNELIPMVHEHGTDLIAFCTDDREPDILHTRGHINDCARMAVAAGTSEVEALLMASTNSAIYHGFHHLGALGPGYRADILCFDSLETWSPSWVRQNGRLVATDGVLVDGVVPDAPAPDWMKHSINVGSDITPDAFDIDTPSNAEHKVIGVTQGSLTTSQLTMRANNPALDIARIACVERHGATGRVGVGLVSGFGLVRGALGSTVAHDAHNILLVGGRDEGGKADMAAAANRVSEIGGGQVVILNGEVLAEIRLPIGGLMSDKPSQVVADELHTLLEAGQRLGVTLEAPFMQLSFLGLSVIPELRITDRGLFDANRFEFTDLLA